MNVSLHEYMSTQVPRPVYGCRAGRKGRAVAPARPAWPVARSPAAVELQPAARVEPPSGPTGPASTARARAAITTTGTTRRRARHDAVTRCTLENMIRLPPE